MNADESLNKFKEFRNKVKTYTKDFLSEADTRCKFIDQLFKSCLGWDEQNIRREHRVSNDTDKTGYADYIFQIHIPLLVVEAKRKDLIFEFPKDERRKYKINGVISKNEDLIEAINQSRSYAENRSIKYAIVTNGIQLIAFIATRTDGIPWRNGECVVFRDLGDIENNYIDFYNLFYKDNLIAHSLEKEFSMEHKILRGNRLIGVLEKPDEPIYRNAYSDAMNKMIEDYFSDIVELADKEVFENCYCTNTEIKLYENNLESLLKDNLPAYATGIKKIILKSFKKKEEFEKDMESYSEGSTTRIPILLIGNLGAGKTTFLRWFFDIKIDKNVRSKIFPIFIDFLKGPVDETKYVDYIQDKILNSLEQNSTFKLSEWNKLQAIYRDLIKREEKGPMEPIAKSNRQEFDKHIADKMETWRGNKFNHIGRLIKYLSTHHGVKVLVVYDNADQKGMDFETKIYQFANMLTMEFRCLSIISLREDSYWQASRVGIFDAYQTHVYHLRAPRFKELLEKRLYFALSKIKKERNEYYTSFGAFKVKIEDLQAFLELIISSMLKHGKGIAILRFLECLACCNMRDALNMFKTFLTSGNTKIESYIANYLIRKGEPVIPFHEFARSVMMQDFRYYSESKSNIVIDLLSVGKGLNVSPFTRLRLLEILSRHKNTSSAIGKGYYKIPDMTERFMQINYDPSYIIEHLNALLKYNLIETDNNIRTTVSKSEYIKITASGEYYLTYLINDFVYLDVIITDIPIFETEVFEKILDIFNKERSQGQRRIKRRLESTELLLDYLAKLENQEMESLQDVSDPIFSIKFIDRIRKSFNPTKQHILNALIAKAYK